MVERQFLSLCWLINTQGEQENRFQYSNPKIMQSTVWKSRLTKGKIFRAERIRRTDLRRRSVETETDDFDDEEPTDDEWQMAMEEDSRNEVETVSYAKWKNDLKGNGTKWWKNDTVNKTVGKSNNDEMQ